MLKNELLYGNRIGYDYVAFIMNRCHLVEILHIMYVIIMLDAFHTYYTQNYAGIISTSLPSF